ncbi:MAG TPA: SH3 domain-containing protein [Candidatus Limnocylindrales bacterium]|nr:SH3 domain-containing protein [Candidatus Limnocylindrales bacterium]
MNCWLALGVMLSTSILAQQVTNAPPSAPIENPVPGAAAATNAPAKAPKKKSNTKKKNTKQAAAHKDPASQLKTVPLVPGPATVEANHVNVRGQPKLKSEVVTRLSKGDSVTVIEEITHNNSGPDEPSAWAKIFLPTNAHVWVNTSFINATNKTVLPKRLNLRSGPGENYSVLGRLVRGDAVTERGAKGDWTEIEAPTNAYAFVAAQYLKQETPTTPAVTEPPPAPTTVAEAPAIGTPPTETPATTAPVENPAATNTLAEASATNAPPTEQIEEPPPKRIVQREGTVRGTFSVQAPTHFELVSPDNGRTIDYLYTTSPNLDLRRYKGLRIIVTGEESLEERWGNTPVITIQKIQVLD